MARLNIADCPENSVQRINIHCEVATRITQVPYSLLLAPADARRHASARPGFSESIYRYAVRAPACRRSDTGVAHAIQRWFCSVHLELYMHHSGQGQSFMEKAILVEKMKWERHKTQPGPQHCSSYNTAGKHICDPKFRRLPEPQPEYYPRHPSRPRW